MTTKGEKVEYIDREHKYTADQKRIIVQGIEENRALGGSSWKFYTAKELIEIYDYLPEWFPKEIL